MVDQIFFQTRCTHRLQQRHCWQSPRPGLCLCWRSPYAVLFRLTSTDACPAVGGEYAPTACRSGSSVCERICERDSAIPTFETCGGKAQRRASSPRSREREQGSGIVASRNTSTHICWTANVDATTGDESPCSSMLIFAGTSKGSSPLSSTLSPAADQVERQCGDPCESRDEGEALERSADRHEWGCCANTMSAKINRVRNTAAVPSE